MTPDEFKQRYNAQAWVVQRLPPSVQQTLDGNPYAYIAKLLMHPVTDGRHRLCFRILPRYAVNVLGLSHEKAYELCKTYMDSCVALLDTDAPGRLDYYIWYAQTGGYRPPTLQTIQEDDPELYQIIVEAIKE